MSNIKLTCKFEIFQLHDCDGEIKVREIFIQQNIFMADDFDWKVQ